ncbi:MAG: LysR substrate-binding domain-containing protein [Burkholderiales bacterium]
MDKLRAIQYFIAAAEERGFSGAARKFNVSVPAVAKLISALERMLGASLFNRNAQGSTLTADGESYLESCKPLLDQLDAADESLRGTAVNVRGTLVVGAPQMLAQHCLLPALPRFHARYPDIQIDIRDVNGATTANANAADVFVLYGWSEPPADLVRKRVGEARFLICAAPSYWAANGIPQRPRDLERHVCLLFRTPAGTVHDLWQLERGGVSESVAASGWLVSSHRDVILDAALAGEGVVRLTDLTIRTHVHNGGLVPVLQDWEMRDAPPVDLLFRPNQRRTLRVRLFIDFVTEIFREIEAERGDKTGARLHAERPRWWARHGRASAAIGKRV